MCLASTRRLLGPKGNNLGWRLSAAYSAYVFVDTKPMSALMGTSLLKVRGKESILGFSSVSNVAWAGAVLGSFSRQRCLLAPV